MAPDSRQLNPVALAAAAHERNLEKKATAQIKKVQPQLLPVLSDPRSVRKPERMKYWR